MSSKNITHVIPSRTKQQVLDTYQRLQPIYDVSHQNGLTVKGLKKAYQAAKMSNDPNTHVGAAVLVNDPVTTKDVWLAHPNIIIGGDKHPERLMERPLKLKYSSHAEMRTLASAYARGYSRANTLYAPWFACMGCAKSIGESGVRRIVGHWATFAVTSESWEDEIKQSMALLDDDYGIELFVYMGEIGNTVRMRDVTYSV